MEDKKREESNEPVVPNVKVISLRWIFLGILAAIVLLLVIGVPGGKFSYFKKRYYYN
jgi:hypothetical protein